MVSRALLAVLAFLVSAQLTLASELPHAAKNANALASPVCLKALVDLDQGSLPQDEDFVRTTCSAGVREDAFRYHAGVTRLARDLARGEIVPVFPEFGLRGVRPGSRLSLVVVAGPVRIERDVEALQAAAPGQSLFVRSADGEIFTARYEEAAR